MGDQAGEILNTYLVTACGEEGSTHSPPSRHTREMKSSLPPFPGLRAMPSGCAEGSEEAALVATSEPVGATRSDWLRDLGQTNTLLQKYGKVGIKEKSEQREWEPRRS